MDNRNCEQVINAHATSASDTRKWGKQDDLDPRATSVFFATLENGASENYPAQVKRIGVMTATITTTITISTDSRC